MNPETIWSKIQKGVFIIAEAGKNFIQTEEDRPVEEYLKNAMRLVDEAAKAGADAIKFQTHNVEDEVLNIDFTSPHFNKKGSDRYTWVTRNTKATPVDKFWRPLKEYCDQKGIVFFSTPMSKGAAKILNEAGVNLWKIGSGDILDFVLLDYLRQSGKPIIISSGMSTLEEVEQAVKFLREKNDKVALLHCVSKYPCPPEELHLKTIDLYKEKFDMPIGFSDHSIGIEPDLVAVAMGATILEKHFSMARTLWGSDHKVSMTPQELSDLVSGVKKVINDAGERQKVLNGDFAKRGMGSKTKVLQEGEAVFRPLFRKSLMAGQDIPAGTVITAEMVYAMRPQQYAGGLPSERYEDVIGKKTSKALKKFDPLIQGNLA
ncbi:MAG: N-acetylneuraminate synthase family protein [Candidatus Harrisonbacteria bacterium]|nr:N-acetylneuraminate synthase family protein [Candidatus Harrisonbacteria bacterium]